MSNTGLGFVGQLASFDFLFALAGNGLVLGHVLLVSHSCVNGSVGVSAQEFTKSLLLVSFGTYIQSNGFYLHDLVKPDP